jgi:hypothetical protein
MGDRAFSRFPPLEPRIGGRHQKTISAPESMRWKSAAATRASRRRGAGTACAPASTCPRPAGADTADLPGGASGMLRRDYKGRRGDRLVTRIGPGGVSMVGELRPRAAGGRGIGRWKARDEKREARRRLAAGNQTGCTPWRACPSIPRQCRGRRAATADGWCDPRQWNRAVRGQFTITRFSWSYRKASPAGVPRLGLISSDLPPTRSQGSSLVRCSGSTPSGFSGRHSGDMLVRGIVGAAALAALAFGADPSAQVDALMAPWNVTGTPALNSPANKGANSTKGP